MSGIMQDVLSKMNSYMKNSDALQSNGQYAPLPADVITTPSPDVITTPSSNTPEMEEEEQKSEEQDYILTDSDNEYRPWVIAIFVVLIIIILFCIGYCLIRLNKKSGSFNPILKVGSSMTSSANSMSLPSKI